MMALLGVALLGVLVGLCAAVGEARAALALEYFVEDLPRRPNE